MNGSGDKAGLPVVAAVVAPRYPGRCSRGAKRTTVLRGMECLLVMQAVFGFPRWLTYSALSGERFLVV